MKILSFRALGIITALLLGIGAAHAQRQRSPEALAAAKAEISSWPTGSRQLGLMLMEKYGAPTTFDRRSMAWDNNRPYAKTIVFRNAPWTKGEFLQQTVPYRATLPAVERIISFDKRIVIDRDAGTMSMTAVGEKEILAAFNLANELAWGIKTPKQARTAYKKALSLSASGKSSPYADHFDFPLGP